MARLIGYISNDNTLTHAVVEHLRGEVDFETTDSDSPNVARGFGWIREGQTLLQKHPPLGVSSVDIGGVMADIRMREIIGYECDVEGDRIDTSDIQPFSFRTWLFAQSAHTSGLSARRESILEDIPDHIRHNIGGETGEELLFHRFMTALHERGGFGFSTSNPEVCVEACAEAIEQLEAVTDRRADVPMQLGNFVAASERLLIAARFETPMYYRRLEGLAESTDEPIFAGQRDSDDQHDHFRGTLVLDDFELDGEDWHEIPERSLLWVTPDWQPHVVSFDEIFETLDEGT